MKIRNLVLSLVAIVTVLAISQRTDSQAQSAQPKAAQPYDPALFAALKWRSIGPNRGGRRRQHEPSLRILLRRSRRRFVEDDRWRSDVEASDRWADQRLFGGSCRRGRVQS